MFEELKIIIDKVAFQPEPIVLYLTAIVIAVGFSAIGYVIWRNKK